MSGLRPLEPQDIPDLVTLSTSLFSREDTRSRQELVQNFDDVFLKNPWVNESIPSWVYTDSREKIIGFLGVTPRRMLFRGEPVSVAVSQHMMVSAEARAPFAPVEMLRKLLGGPQDLTIADMANDISRKIWERLGGEISPAFSIHWRRPLRPARFAAQVLGNRDGVSSVVALGARFCAAPVDLIAARSRMSPMRVSPPPVQEEQLNTTTHLDAIRKFSEQFTLRPEYTVRDLEWIAAALRRQQYHGAFQEACIRSPEGDLLGWYMYFVRKSGSSEVVQVCARPETMSVVLDSLLFSSWSKGCVDLAGRLDPLFMKTFSEKSCLFSPGRYWMLVHSRKPEILNAIHRADAFLTRLEGDLWLV